jgi:DNA-binding winged helix-turn-helix (wHTH) protein
VKVSFGPFVLDSGRRRLSHGGQDVHLSPKAFDLLALLVKRRPNVVDKDTLIATIWPDTVVLDANLNVLVGEIRKALSDSPQRRQFIETVNRVGFAFCGEAVDLEAMERSPRDAQRARFWLTWPGGTQVLSDGDNILGRHPDCEVFIDGDGVSRRHARITVDTQRRQAIIEDLESTNGTLVKHTPLTSRVTLANGDLIGIGSIELTFRAWLDEQPPTKRIPRLRS